MVKVKVDLADFRGNTEAEFVKWLKTILIRTASNLARANRAQRNDIDRTVNETYSSALNLAQLCMADSSECPQRRLSQAELLTWLSQTLGSLGTDQRRAVTMVYLHSKKVDEAALSLGRSPEAVAGLVYRGVEKLKRLKP